MFRQISARACYAVVVIVSFFMLSCGVSMADGVLKTAKGCVQIPVRVVKQVKIPRWYHEGMYYDGKSLWLCNGEKGKIWIVDPSTGDVTSEIEPIADFTEALTAGPDGILYTTEWYAKNIYRVRLEGNKLVQESSVGVAPAHPAGIIWNGRSLFVVIWNRTLLGTKFSLLEMDEKMGLRNTITISSPQEPDHLAWDGEYLWLTSWFDQRVYKIDTTTWEIIGYFCSPVAKTTGIAWDGKYFWITGTYGDLYQMEVGTQDPNLA